MYCVFFFLMLMRTPSSTLTYTLFPDTTLFRSGAFRQAHFARHIGRAEVELGTVVCEERRVAAAFVLREHIDLGVELGVRRDRTRLGEHLATFHFVAADTADQRADVVAGLTLIEELAEHFDAGDDGLAGVVNANDLDFLADLDDAGFDTTRNDSTATRDREHVFDRHQERPVERTRRLRDPADRKSTR